MNIFFVAIIIFLLFRLTVRYTAERLNLSRITSVIPKDLEGLYDPERYRTSQDYLKDNTRLILIHEFIVTGAIILFIVAGGFSVVDSFVRSLNLNFVITGLLFVGALGALLEIIDLPFSIYRTFGTEKKYGFNKTTVGLFIGDLLKTWIIGVIIGGVLFAAIFILFGRYPDWGWLFAWIFVAVVEIIIVFLAPVVIMPLFNKFIPLSDGELKQQIEDYAKREKFALGGIYTMDGSKRSTKSNAYFTGFGKLRRIVLFDTLIANHTTEELVAVLAHEMGHYKKHHILLRVILSVLQLGMMFFIVSLLLKTQNMYAGFGLYPSVYTGIVLAMILYTPIEIALKFFDNKLSRTHEYEADRYAAVTYGRSDAMIDALKKLSRDNLTNLTPHPFKVALDYSHPPIGERISALQKIPSKKISNENI